ncbi:MAG TPA: hypothetical protein VMV78_01165 [Thiobacillus sp.]|nr:hypothetical protein [Thiobacillus sp.]
MFEQHAEFVAARVAVAQAFMQTLSDLSQQLVARRVTAGVVHDLEPVEIEIEQRVFLTVSQWLVDPRSSRRSNS